MKVYCFGEKEKPVIFLFPGTCCHWKGNFGKVIEPLEEYFRVACVSYDGFDETEQTEFPTMTEETEKIEQYIKKEFGGHICAASISLIVRPPVPICSCFRSLVFPCSDASVLIHVHLTFIAFWKFYSAFHTFDFEHYPNR